MWMAAMDATERFCDRTQRAQMKACIEDAFWSVSRPELFTHEAFGTIPDAFCDKQFLQRCFAKAGCL
jgi:hypothetical protein